MTSRRPSARRLVHLKQVLLAADLTPYEGIVLDEDEVESTSSGNDNSRDREGSDGTQNGDESLSRRQVTYSRERALLC